MNDTEIPDDDYRLPTPGIIEIPSKLLDIGLSADAIKLYLIAADTWRPGHAVRTMDLIARAKWGNTRFFDALLELESLDVLRLGINAGGLRP